MSILKKHLFIISLALALVMPIGLAPRPVNAQFDAMITNLTSAKWIWERIGIIFNTAREAVSMDLVERAFNMYMSNLSYTVANELATGGPGGKPSFRTLSIKDASQKALEAAGGEFISLISKQGFDQLGLNLCNPSVAVKLSLTLSLIDSQAPPPPKCDWTNVKNQWAKFGDSFANDLVKFQLDPRSGAKNIQSFWTGISEQSDVNTFFTLQAGLNKKLAEEEQAKMIAAEECQGFLDKATTITEEVKVHCTKIKGISDAEYTAALQAEIAKKQSSGDQKTSNVKAFAKIMKDAGSLFVNTFSSKLLSQWIKKGTWSLFGNEKNTSLRDDLLTRLRGGADIRQPRNQQIFEDLKTTTLEKVEDYSLINDFIVCPSEEQARRPDNCVIDAQFAEAISSGKTINQAIQDGSIDGNMILIGKDDVLRNNSDNCYREAFCYSNLVKLRKANVIPIGWELAALRSLVTSPVSLKTAIECFEDNPTSDCPLATDAKYSVDNTPHNPMYHLIDGNWVLKAPKAMCEALVYGSVLESPDTADRQQYCADFKTCLRHDENGECINEQYGYCTKTENIWRFKGDICEDGEIYAGCLNFSSKEFGVNSYIEGSLDYCDATDAGCRRYSQEKLADGRWILQAAAVDNNDLFLTNRAQTCPETQAGCHEYISMEPDQEVNIIPNGNFSDANQDTFPDGWFNAAGGPTTAQGYSTSTGTGVLKNNNAVVYHNVVLSPHTSYALSGTAFDREAFIAVEACDVGQNCNLVAAAGPVPGRGTCEFPVQDRAALKLQAGETKSCTFMTNDIAIGEARINIYSNAGVAGFSNIKLEVISNTNQNASAFSVYGEGGKINMNGSRVMCTAREVGCQGYTPANGDPLIPAVISQDDLCPAECVGYATFAEQPTSFDLIQDPASPVKYFNFIANTATSCPISAAGCEEFTNLDAVAQGGEGREYFTSVRQCVSEPEGTEYYTWSGSDTEGYQIKTVLAKMSNLDGGPCTNVLLGGSNCIDNAATQALCVQADMATNPDCREYFDRNGDPFYRLDSRVIFASDDCHDYRRTITAITYRIIPGISNGCSASQNDCRLYYGNTANNVRKIFQDNFESGTFQPWTGNLDVSVESLQNHGHSMKINVPANDSAERPLTDLHASKKYQLSFWLKGEANMKSIIPMLSINDAANVLHDYFLNTKDGTAMGPIVDTRFVTVEGGNWNYFTITAYVDFPGFVFNDLNTGKLTLRIDNSAAPVYVDNIVLREITDAIAVIKHSWNTPPTCDQPYEGYNLGCQIYTDTNRKTFYLKSFDRLCREEAIGCTAVIDTHNSDNPEAETFHDTDENGNPTPGENSIITIPADSIDYLVPDPAKYCPSTYQGCSELGMPDRNDDTKFTTVYKINDPDQYGTSLCRANALYCSEFNSSKGMYYFKYPGQQTCTYQQNVNINGNIFAGWFKTPSIGLPLPEGCSNGLPGDPNINGFDPVDLALDPDTVSSCPASKNLCTVFKDPTDPAPLPPTFPNPCELDIKEDYCSNAAFTTTKTCIDGGGTWHRACKSYYYYDNENIDNSSCLGQVDRGTGCILFYEGNNWNALHTAVMTSYNSQDSYNLNISDDKPVSPITCNTGDPNCDSNRLIKVRNDRQCSEWLSCKSSSAAWDKITNSYVILCNSLDSCVQYDKGNNITNCKKWAEPIAGNPAPLTVQDYQKRTGQNTGGHLTWSDQEYIGYSIPGLLPARSLVTFDFSTDENIVNSRLVYPVAAPAVCAGNDGEVCSVTMAGVDCQAGSVDCYLGECQSVNLIDYCWVSPQVGDTFQNTYNVETRGYAEKDAPFSNAIEPNGKRISNYQEANLCLSTSTSCEPEYQKISYGTSGGVDYYGKGAASKEGVCIAGDQTKVKKRFACTTNDVCDSPDRVNGGVTTYSTDGICALKSKIETLMNWSGICLQKDESTPLILERGRPYYCNQWYPVNTISGVNSMFDNDREAGYYNENGDVQFCMQAAPYELESDRYYCGSADVNGCNVLIKVPKGTKIRIAALDDPSIVEREKILNQHYLKGTGDINETYARYDANTPIPNSANTIIFERIESKTGTEKFGPLAFVNLTSNELTTVPTHSMADLLKFFDAIVANPIESFYIDTILATYSGSGSRHTYNTCDGHVLDWMQDNNMWCDSASEHLAYAYRFYNDDKCGWFGGGHDEGWVYCNPGLLHYYVNIADNQIVECRDTNCSIAANKGIACLNTKPKFVELLSNLIYADPPSAEYGFCEGDRNLRCSNSVCVIDGRPYNCWKYQWVQSLTLTPKNDYSACNMGAGPEKNPNCEFTKCIFDIVMPPPGLPQRTDLDPNTHNIINGVTWCSDYGKIVKEEIPYCSNTRGCNLVENPRNYNRLVLANNTFTSISDITGCFAKLIEKKQLTVDDLNNFFNSNIPETIRDELRANRPIYTYVPRAGVYPDLIKEAFGQDDGVNPRAVGCLTSDVKADCRDITGYGPQSSQLHCAGNECYQMCSLVNTLDATGDKSWVRTDIWWRAAVASGDRVLNPLWTGPVLHDWLSYYYKSGSFDRDANVVFDRIKLLGSPQGDLPEDYFGAGVGPLSNNRPVLVQSPVGTNVDSGLSAATFFSTVANPAEIKELFYIFGRVYKFKWDTTLPTPIYVFDGNETADLWVAPEDTLPSAINTYAGPTYNPKILRVCGDDYNKQICADGDGKGINGITVNNSNDQPVTGYESIFVSAKFFYYAHPDHMPVKSIDVDWGDGPVAGTFIQNPGKYKNALDKCDKDALMPQKEGLQGFGGLPQACREGYKVFYHDYQYDANPAVQCQALGQPYANAACFKPKIRIYDQWGKVTDREFADWVVVYEQPL
ncbi:MAG: hypothetical protein C3F02_02705 [Parcubacteria group bacterium]|nr:MAG: hypothetical protein C3F02_02705 [Parcubacteria group bacterium]